MDISHTDTTFSLPIQYRAHLRWKKLIPILGYTLKFTLIRDKPAQNWLGNFLVTQHMDMHTHTSINKHQQTDMQLTSFNECNRRYCRRGFFCISDIIKGMYLERLPAQMLPEAIRSHNNSEATQNTPSANDAAERTSSVGELNTSIITCCKLPNPLRSLE